MGATTHSRRAISMRDVTKVWVWLDVFWVRVCVCVCVRVCVYVCVCVCVCGVRVCCKSVSAVSFCTLVCVLFGVGEGRWCVCMCVCVCMRVCVLQSSTHKWMIPVWHTAFACVTRVILGAQFICITWHILDVQLKRQLGDLREMPPSLFDMTYSRHVYALYVWHDSCFCVSCLIHLCVSFTLCWTWRILGVYMPTMYGCFCVSRLIHLCKTMCMCHVL